MLLIGLKNTATQEVLADGIINLGSVYRRYDKKGCNCGLRAFEVQGNGLALQQSGIYHITALFNFTAATAGDVIIQLLVNGIVIDGASITQTITTATTEFENITIDYYVVVDNGCVLGNNTTIAQTISFQNVSDAIDITLDNVIVNVEKVV